jgi:beta-lactamase regulating signal transducer with metallopeptidase domain
VFDSALIPWGSGTVWIVGVAVKGAAVLLVVVLVATMLRRASAGLRHLVWSGGILAVLLLPVASLVLPWQLPVESVRMPVDALSANRVEAATTSPEAAEQEPGVGELPGVTGTRERTRLRFPGGTPTEWLFVIWGAGVLLFLTRLGFGAVVVRRVLHGATPLDSSDWTHPLIEAADRLSVSRLPRLLTNDRVPMPVVCGVFKPAIVVPSEASDWTDRRRRAVLCHELAHIRRLDLPANLVGRLACALHWFNPLVWIAARQLRAESERACDDFVLGVGTRPSEYADHLLQIVGGARHAQAPAVAIPMAQRREFEGRMLAILDQDVRREPPSLRHSTGIAALAFVLLLPIAAITPAPAMPSVAAEHSHPSETQPDSGSGSPGLLGALLEGLEAADADERADAANALGTLRERGAVDLLGESVRNDPDSTVRLTAAWALGQIASLDATAALSAAALRDEDVEVRGMAAWALGQVADPAALPTLEAVLGDARAAVRNRASWAIGTIRPNSAPASLLEALADTNDAVSEVSAWALGQIGDPSAVPALTGVAQDRYSKASYEALRSLAQIGGAGAQRPLREALGLEFLDSKLRDAIERALAGESIEPQPRPWPIPAIR